MQPKNIKKIEELKEVLAGLKAKGEKVIFTNGCFDILHLGHIKYLSEAKNLGGVLVVGVNSDSSVKKIKKGPRPICGESERAAIIASLKAVDWVCVFDEIDPRRLIEEIKPDILVKGADWKDDEIIGADFVKLYGGRVVRIPYVKGYSSSSIIDKILKGRSS